MYTPGPWSIHRPRAQQGAYEVGTDDCRVAIIRDVRRFAPDGDIDPSTEGIPRANADLVAAAPDLLAIVKEMVEVIEWSERRTRPHWDGAVSDNSTIGRARAAIAKAELSPDPSPGIS